MTAQHIIARFAQLTSKRLTIAAFALGLSATLLASVPVHAAPLRPEVDPGGPSFAKPDLTATVSMPNGIFLTPGDRTRFVVVAKNQGTGAAVPTEIYLELPYGFKDFAIQSPAGFNCASAPTKFFDSKTVTVTCKGGKVSAGASATVVIDATVPADPGTRGALGAATAVGNSKDTNHDNNGSLLNFLIL